MKSDMQIFSQFRDGLKEDMVLELWNHGVSNLKKAYVLVQDLDAPELSYRSLDHRAPTFNTHAS